MVPAECTRERDPVLDLMGWHAEPALLKRLMLYIAEGVVEFAALVTAMCLAEAQLSPSGLFVRLLLLPCSMVALKLCWALRLAWSYYRVKHADIGTALRRMGCVHMRGFWTCSAAMFTCISCMLMVWHSIMFLLMTGYEYKEHQALAAQFLLAISAVFVIMNWAFWRDFVRNYRDSPEEGADFDRIYQIYLMYKQNVIRLCKYKDVAGLEGKAAASACAVCLEDFAADDDVSQLPCGHAFHPTCIHKWMREDWRCPFRCVIDPARSPKPAELGLGAELPSDPALDLEAQVF